MWSGWTFVIHAHPSKLPSVLDVVDNTRRYAARLFRTTMGQANVKLLSDHRWLPGRLKALRNVWKGIGAHHYYVIEIVIEGAPVNDPAFIRRIRHEFEGVFVQKGFGPSARLVKMDARLLAGSPENGRPAAQLLVLPRVDFSAQV